MDRDVIGGPVGQNWLRHWLQTLNLSFTFPFYISCNRKYLGPILRWDQYTSPVLFVWTWLNWFSKSKCHTQMLAISTHDFSQIWKWGGSLLTSQPWASTSQYKGLSWQPISRLLHSNPIFPDCYYRLWVSPHPKMVPVGYCTTCKSPGIARYSINEHETKPFTNQMASFEEREGDERERRGRA